MDTTFTQEPVSSLAKVAQNSGMGQFQEGQKRPRGSGRKPGTPNKKTVQLKEFFEKAKFNIPERILEILPQLPVSKQADLLVDLMAYVYPKLKNVELETIAPPEQQCIRIEFVKDGLPEN